MARGFETGSDNEKIDELQKQLDDVLDSQISSVGGNEDISIDSSRGARNAASGDAGGVRSNEPIIHNITDVDEGGTPTGVFDKINIISSMAIIDHTSTPITLRFIQGPAKDGARIKITPKIGKVINIESGGNILTSSTITITDTDYYELVKYSEAETGVTGGAFKILLIGSGGGGEFFGPWTANHDAGNFALNNVSSIQISDPAGGIHSLLQGLAGTGTRLTLTAGEKFEIFDNITPLVTINQTSGLDMLSHQITNTLFIESDTANRPGSGFVRMAHSDQVRWKNVLNDDDLYINAARPTLDSLTQDAIEFNVAGGPRMYIGQFDISVEQNDIINTGDIIPSGVHEVGLIGNTFNRMHSDFFEPSAAGVVGGRYGLAKTGNTLYVNFDDTNVDAGFGIFEQGVQRFLFSRFGSTPFVNEFFIGGDPFLAGEEYRIQMGENSTSSARIFFIEGTGNDLILDRAGAGIDQGVQIRGAGLSIARFLSTSIKIFQPLDANAKDLFNVVDIKSNGGGGATTGTIGELITNDGGFNYFMRDTLAWESNIDTKLTFGSGGITVETNSSNADIDILAPGTDSDIDIRAATGGFLSLGRSGVNHLQFASGVSQFSNANVTLSSGAQEVQFNDAVAGASANTPIAGDINLFNDLTTGELSVKKPGGVVVSLEDTGASGANTALSNLASVAINVSLLPNADGTLNNGSATLAWNDVFQERVRIELGGSSTSTANQIIADGGGMIFNTPAGDRYEFNISGSPNGIAIEEDRIEFLTSGRQHRIDVTASSINILSENISDSVEIWTGTGRTNATIDINSTTTTFLTQTSDVQAVLIQLIQNNNTPSDFRTIGNIDFMAENSSSVNEIYARISASSQDITNATEDGLLQLGVVSGGVLVSGIDIEGSSSGGANDALIGFFGETPVVQQQLDSNPSNTEISTALRNLGLTHL